MSSPLRPTLSRLAALLLFCCAGLAQAQFVWIAPNGTRVYSDQPPPPGTPSSKIVKAPGRPAPAQVTPGAPNAPDAAPPADAAAPNGPPTLAEREADYRKRAKARDESALKSQEEARIKAARAEQCEQLRKSQRMYQSGMRIADIGPDGQRRFLNDAERAAAAERNAKQLGECR